MTSLAEQEAKILANLQVIRELWDHMLPTITGIPMGLNGGSRPTGARTSMGKSKNDNSDKNTNVDNLDIVMSDRRLVTDNLRSWGKHFVKAFNITATVPNGSDVPGMCTFLETWTRHITGHEDAAKFADAMSWCASRTLRHAKPVTNTSVGTTTRDELQRLHDTAMRKFTNVGQCPLTDEDDGSVCGGKVRAYPEDDDTNGDAWAVCRQCGTRAVVSWWTEQMNVEQTVTYAGLQEFIRREFGKDVPRGTIRRWLSTGVIESCGADENGLTLFDKGAVAYALQIKLAPRLA